MRKTLRRSRPSSLSLLYDQFQLSRAVRRSLNLILLANLFGNLHGIICGGGTTAMVGLANELKAGDLAFGLINGIPQAAALLQIPFSILVSRTQARKKYMLTLGLFSRALWILFGLIPIVVPTNPAWLPLWTMIFLLGLSSCCGAIINVCWLPWLSDLAPQRLRAQWFSYRDMVVAGFNLAFGLLVAWMLDTLPLPDRYAIIFALGGVLGMLDMICFGFCREQYSDAPRKRKIGSVLKSIRSNRPFCALVTMWTAWCFTSNLCGPYLARYSINEMSLSFMQMTVFGSAASAIATVLVMRRWGRAMSRYGCRSVMLVSTVITSLTDGFYLFSVPGAVWPVLLRNLVGAACWSGANLAANSMQLSASPDEARPSYIAVFACVTSLVGVALGTLCGGALLEGWENAGWFSGSFDRFKVLILISVILRLLVALLLVRPLENDREGTPRAMVTDALHAVLRRRRLRS
ncbi:MAG: MFS transporter [Clostridia bacterium]|nr:MFS transporter [Clostridia bacterium]